MLAIEESTAAGSPVSIESTTTAVAQVPPEWDPNARTAGSRDEQMEARG
jgi:hypothetical protein